MRTFPTAFLIGGWGFQIPFATNLDIPTRNVYPSIRSLLIFLVPHYVNFNMIFGPQLATSQQLKVHATPTKTATVVPPEDGCLTPEICRGLRHNKVFVIVKV
jgi:hypothetical protein